MTSPARRFKVLFVCMGNICRSPAAEGVFRDFVRKAGLSATILIDSAGTIGYHAGSPPDHRMQETALRRGYKLDSIARQVSRSDFDEFDLVVPMDHENYDDLMAITRDRTGNIRLLGSFITDSEDPAMVQPVPDPYYGGEEGFEKVLDMIESACPAMLEYCLASLDRVNG